MHGGINGTFSLNIDSFKLSQVAAKSWPSCDYQGAVVNRIFLGLFHGSFCFQVTMKTDEKRQGLSAFHE